MARYKITRINKDESDLVFKIKFPTGKSQSDIQDAVFVIKENDNDSYSQKIVEKTFLGGEISTLSPNFLKVNFDVADYDNLVIGTLYRSALFCKWNGNSDFDENVEQIFDFEITQDFHNL